MLGFFFVILLPNRELRWKKQGTEIYCTTSVSKAGRIFITPLDLHRVNKEKQTNKQGRSQGGPGVPVTPPLL